MANVRVALAVVGGLFAGVIVCFAAICGYLYFWGIIESPDGTSAFHIKDMRLKSFHWWKRHMPDLEMGGDAIELSKGMTSHRNSVYGQKNLLVISPSTNEKFTTDNDGPLQELYDVLQGFDTTTIGVLGNRLPSSMRPLNTILSIEISKDRDPVVNVPSDSAKRYITDQYETFARTVLLQSMIGNSLNPENVVFKKVRDPYLDSLINVGGIVVVAKPYHGHGEFDFHHLLPGDLLSVVKFYVRDDNSEDQKSLLLKGGTLEKTLGNTFLCDDEPKRDTTKLENPMLQPPPFIDRSDPHYAKIYCTGIKLETYLEYDDSRKFMALKYVNTPANNPGALRDFPLSVVTLETTVLEHCD